MNRKAVLAIVSGVLVAAIMCIIAGVIMYFTAKGNAILFLVGIFTICMGSIIAVVPLIFLIVLLIMTLIANKKRNKNTEQTNDR